MDKECCLCFVLVIQFVAWFASLAWELINNVGLYNSFYGQFIDNCDETSVLLYLNCYDPLESVLANLIVSGFISTSLSVSSALFLAQRILRQSDEPLNENLQFILVLLNNAFAFFQAVDIVKDSIFLLNFDLDNFQLIAMVGDIVSSLAFLGAVFFTRATEYCGDDYDELLERRTALYLNVFVEDALAKLEETAQDQDALEQFQQMVNSLGAAVVGNGTCGFFLVLGTLLSPVAVWLFVLSASSFALSCCCFICAGCLAVCGGVEER